MPDTDTKVYSTSTQRTNEDLKRGNFNSLGPYLSTTIKLFTSITGTLFLVLILFGFYRLYKTKTKERRERKRASQHRIIRYRAGIRGNGTSTGSHIEAPALWVLPSTCKSPVKPLPRPIQITRETCF